MSERIPGPAYKILTPRCCLRCWEPRDAAQLKAAIEESREHLKPWMPWAHAENSMQDQINRMREIRGNFDLGKDFMYGILDRDEHMVLGSTGLHTRRGAFAREIGYWIHVDHIGKGLATEISAALTKAAFEIEGMDRVEIHCDPANTPSAAVPRKLGYTHEATLRRRTRWPDGRYTDSMIFTLFASDYPESPASQIEIQAFDATGRQIM